VKTEPKLTLEEKDVIKAEMEQQEEEFWSKLEQAYAEREEDER